MSVVRLPLRRLVEGAVTQIANHRTSDDAAWHAHARAVIEQLLALVRA
jgi:hypothetical protein